MILMTGIHATSGQGRVVQATIVIGAQEEDATKLHILGTVQFRGQEYGVRGTIWVREGRDTPDANFYRCDTGERINDDVALDILYAVFSVLDEQEDGIIAQEMKRICE